MKSGVLLNAELSSAIAHMGNGDLMIVCYAGFPIPSAAWQVDLSITQDVTDLNTVLRAISSAFIAEKVLYADALPGHNPKPMELVRDIFDDADHEMIAHETILTEMAARAKVIVRTGAVDPWGNILLYSGVDLPKRFAKHGTVAPQEYERN